MTRTSGFQWTTEIDEIVCCVIVVSLGDDCELTFDNATADGAGICAIHVDGKDFIVAHEESWY